MFLLLTKIENEIVSKHSYLFLKDAVSALETAYQYFWLDCPNQCYRNEMKRINRQKAKIYDVKIGKFGFLEIINEKDF